MSLFLQTEEDLPTLNDEHVESITDKLYECAFDFFSGTNEMYDGACFAENGPSLKELTEYAIEEDDGKLQYWGDYAWGDALDNIVESAKYMFSNYTELEWGSKLTHTDAEQYNDGIRMLIGEIEWALAENMYEYLVKEYPDYGDDNYDDLLERVNDYYTVDECNGKADWRLEYLNKNGWTVTEDEDNRWCGVCDDDVPHFVKLEREKESIKVGCRDEMCAVCGDGSM